jgi:hypothetical protein
LEGTAQEECEKLSKFEASDTMNEQVSSLLAVEEKEDEVF